MWAGEHSCESQPLEAFAESASSLFALLGEREVGKPGMLARQSPGGLPVSRQIDDGKLVLHHIIYLRRSLAYAV